LEKNAPAEKVRQCISWNFGRRRLKMIIGEIVEILIREKDKYSHGDYRKEAIEEACNLLDRLPPQEEATTYEPLKN
jgi:hypothetical protein